jgi:hypothetical protein
MSRVTLKIKKDVKKFISSIYDDNISIITPELLDKKTLLQQKPSHIDDEDWIQNCRWIVHTIMQLSFDKRFEYSKAEDYVPLYSKVLKENCGNNYNVYLQGLLDSRIIECDDLYSKTGHESFGFKLADNYASSPNKHITLTDKFLVKRIRKFRRKKIEELQIKAAPIAHLVRWLTNDGLQIDKTAAFEFLETYKRKLTTELSKRKLKKSHQKKQEAFVLKRYYKLKDQIESWRSNKYISIDDAGGRLYSPITGLPSLFRNFLTYKGEQLVGFDIKNSQPLHFLTMLKKEFWKSYTPGMTLKRLDSDLWEYLTEEEEYSSTIMFQESAETQYRHGVNNYTFKNLVQNGKLYEFICYKFFNKHHTKGGIDRFSTRAKTKQEFMHMMYHNPKEPYTKAKAVFEEFEKLFPKEASVMNLLKKRKYNDFPIILQKIEAQILLHKVAKRVYDVNSNIPLFTIHDSILTTEQHASTLKFILEDEYKKLLGFIPQFEKTEYSEHNAWKEINKYTKSKVDQADVEISEDGFILPESFRFLKCEHWDFEKKLKKKIVIPDFANHNTTPIGLERVTTKNPFQRKLKK